MLGCVLPHIIEECLTYSTVQKITKKIRRGNSPGYCLFYSFEHLQFVYTPLLYTGVSSTLEAVDEILETLFQSLLLESSLRCFEGCSVLADGYNLREGCGALSLAAQLTH